MLKTLENMATKHAELNKEINRMIDRDGFMSNHHRWADLDDLNAKITQIEEKIAEICRKSGEIEKLLGSDNLSKNLEYLLKKTKIVLELEKRR